MKVLKICAGTWSNESRDEREMSVYGSLGAETAVMAKGDRCDCGRMDNVHGFAVYRYSTKFGGPSALDKVRSLRFWARHVADIKPDIISGHDVPGMGIAWLYARHLPQAERPFLIYDAHEYEPARNTMRSRLRTKMVCRIEKFLIGKCNLMIVVNQTVAKEYKKYYDLRLLPLSVRNIPPEAEREPQASAAVRMKYEQAVGEGFFIMYHGIICPGRGIEKAIRSLKPDSGLRLVILGNATSREYMESLRALAASEGVSERIYWHPAVPNTELTRYIGASDASIMIIEPITKSYMYALPNKLFESIQAGIPVIASDIPEMKKIVNDYGVGLVCSHEDQNDINAAIARIKNEKDNYAGYKRNVAEAAGKLCWENESLILAEAFRTMINNGKKNRPY